MDRKGGLRAGRYVIVDVLEAVWRLPHDFLYRRIRHISGRCRYDVCHHPRLGLILRPYRRGRCRPNRKPMGQVSPLSAVSGSALQHYRRTDIPHSSVGQYGQSGICFCHLRADDDGLFSHQRALRVALGRDECRHQGSEYPCHLPHGVCLFRFVHRLAALYTVGQCLRRGRQ